MKTHKELQSRQTQYIYRHNGQFLIVDRRLNARTVANSTFRSRIERYSRDSTNSMYMGRRRAGGIPLNTSRTWSLT